MIEAFLAIVVLFGAIATTAAVLNAGNASWRNDQVRDYRRSPEPGARERHQASTAAQRIQSAVCTPDRRMMITGWTGDCAAEYTSVYEPTSRADELAADEDARQVAEWEDDWNRAHPRTEPERVEYPVQAPSWQPNREWEHIPAPMPYQAPQRVSDPAEAPIEVPNWPVKVR